MQHLGAAGRDLLRLVIVKRPQETRGRGRARVGAEHSGHVRPDLEPARAELGGEIGRRGVGAAAAEKDRVAFGIARDETLSDHDRREGRQALRERRIGSETTRDVENTGLGGGAALLGEEHGARVGPVSLQPLSAQEARTEVGSEKLAARHTRARVRSLTSSMSAMPAAI